MKAFAIRLGRQITDVSDIESDLLLNGLLAVPKTTGREECNKRIADYWLQKMVDAHPTIDVTPFRRSDIFYTYTIGELSTETFDFSKGIPKTVRVGKLHADCIELFEKAFPEVLKQYKYQGDRMNWVLNVSYLANLSMLRVPPKRSPVLQVTISVSPTFKKQPNSYDLFEQ
jgi:hypothetical protein